jgi:hypothetical protein
MLVSNNGFLAIKKTNTQNKEWHTTIDQGPLSNCSKYRTNIKLFTRIHEYLIWVRHQAG